MIETGSRGCWLCYKYFQALSVLRERLKERISHEIAHKTRNLLASQPWRMDTAAREILGLEVPKNDQLNLLCKLVGDEENFTIHNFSTRQQTSSKRKIKKFVIEHLFQRPLRLEHVFMAQTIVSRAASRHSFGMT